MRQHRRHNEDGASLVMVLVFISVFGLILAGLLTEAGASVKYTKNVKDHEALVYAADAGVSAAIQQLQQNNDICPQGGIPGPGIPNVTVNGSTVATTCSVTSGSAFGSSGFAVITTATGANSLRLLNAQAKQIKGPVFVNGNVSWGPGLQLSNGNFYQLKQPDGSCQAAPTSSQLSIAAPYGAYVCKTPADLGIPSGQTLPATPHAPPAKPVPTDPVPFEVGTCRIFTPGVYTSPPDLRKGDNYFVSGTYYFNFTTADPWNVKQSTIYGGQRDAANEPRAFVPAPSCATSSDAAYGGTGTGVEWVFGGTSRLYIDTQGAVELFARTGEAGATSRISLVGVPNEPAWTNLGYAPNTLAAGTPILEIKDGNQQDVSIHGMLYAPNQDVILTATNTVLAQTLGGMVVSHLTMQSSASAQGLTVSITLGPADPREIVITATAADPDGGRAVVSTAVVQIANDAAKTVTVKSWRTRGPSDAT